MCAERLLPVVDHAPEESPKEDGCLEAECRLPDPSPPCPARECRLPDPCAKREPAYPSPGPPFLPGRPSPADTPGRSDQIGKSSATQPVKATNICSIIGGWKPWSPVARTSSTR